MPTKINLSLYSVHTTEFADVMKKNQTAADAADAAAAAEYVAPECAICYKRLHKDVFICSEPCNKLFHPNCLERMMDETENAAAFAYTPQQHRCCYCRREINMTGYLKEIYINALMKMKAGGYCIDEALQEIELNGVDGDKGYAIYLLVPIEHIKKPKQTKKIKTRKPFKIQRRNVMFQRIGCGVRKR